MIRFGLIFLFLMPSMIFSEPPPWIFYDVDVLREAGLKPPVRESRFDSQDENEAFYDSIIVEEQSPTVPVANSFSETENKASKAVLFQDFIDNFYEQDRITDNRRDDDFYDASPSFY